MKLRLFAIATLLVTAVLALASIGVAGNQGLVRADLDSPAVELPDISLNINLGSDPELDPAKAGDLSSINTVKRLFTGLVEIDPDSGQVLPQLADSWDVSPDGLVYTFNLRDDALWTDGSQVTAEDVQYGILRSLDPAMDAWVYPLFIIENAEAYNSGVINDPSQVGVKIIDDTHLQIILNEPAAYLPTLLDMPAARPVPRAAIEAWGDSWTEPEHIVSSGPYNLMEWDHDQQIVIEKNPGYFEEEEVQIEHINMGMEGDGVTAWDTYVAGEFDIVDLPSGVVPGAVESQELQQQYTGCATFFGIVNNKPPFDDVRVRKAFAMSINKQKFATDGRRLANQFAPPGAWGAPEPGSVGLDFDAAAARALLNSYLAEKGMTLADFNALDITYLYNTTAGNAAVAALAQQEWARNLGVNVRVEDEPWSEYLGTISKSTPLAEAPHMFRMGWCGDYADENNWVHTFFNNQAGGNSVRRGCVDDVCQTEIPKQFDQLTQQAKFEQDPATRKNLYFEAERILAEEEAAYIPLYFHGKKVATKPYLETSSKIVSGFDIGSWRITRANAIIEATGGTVTSYDGDTTIILPSGIYSETAVVTHTPLTGIPPGISLAKLGDNAFEIEAVDGETGEPIAIAEGETYTIVVDYDQSEVGPIDESTLGLYFWDENAWMRDESSVLDIDANTISANAGRNGQWAVFGEVYRIFLPDVLFRY